MNCFLTSLLVLAVVANAGPQIQNWNQMYQNKIHGVWGHQSQVSKTFQVSGVATISLRYYAFDTWDAPHGDYGYVKINGKEVAGKESKEKLTRSDYTNCAGWNHDASITSLWNTKNIACYKDLTFKVPAVNGQVILTIGAHLNQAREDESFGFNNVKVVKALGNNEWTSSEMYQGIHGVWGGHHSVSRTYKSLGETTVSLRYYALDTWDSGDYGYVKINGKEVAGKSVLQRSSGSGTCDGWHTDAKITSFHGHNKKLSCFKDLTFKVPAVNSEIQITIGAHLDQGRTDESFGFTNVAVRGQTYQQYLQSQQNAGKDEVGAGYHNGKDTTTTITSLPEVCRKLCVGEKCRRHCIQSVLHGTARDKFAKDDVTLTKQLEKAKALKESLSLQLASTRKQLTYHTRKTLEWMDAAKKQHALDEALKHLKTHRDALDRAHADFKKAKTARMAALAQRDAATLKKKVAQDLLDKAQAVKKQAESQLAQEQTTIGELKKKLSAHEKTAKGLQDLLHKTKGEITTHTTARDTHETTRAQHETARVEHEKKQKAAEARIKQSTSDEAKSSSDHAQKHKEAKESHDKAKAKGTFVETEEDDFLGADHSVGRDFF